MSGRAVICAPLTNTAPSERWRSETASSSKGLVRSGNCAGWAQVAPMLQANSKAMTLTQWSWAVDRLIDKQKNAK